MPHDGVMCDLMWSDPEESIEGFSLSPRGAGYIFGSDVVERFNRVNNILTIKKILRIIFLRFIYSLFVISKIIIRI